MEDEGAPGWQRNNYASMFAVFLLCITFSFTIPFLPLYLNQLDSSLTGQQAALWAGIATALGGLGSFVSGPIWGILGDRYGRKPMLIRACFGGAIGLTLFGFATSIWQVVAIRTFIGIMAGAPAAAMALIAAGTPATRLPKALGQFQGATLGGIALGPVIAAVFIAAFGYRPTFIVAGILMFSGALVTVFMIKEPTRALAAKPGSGTLGLRTVLKSPLAWAALMLVLLLSFAAPMVQPVLPTYILTLLPDPEHGGTVIIGWIFFGMSAASAIAAVYAGRLISRAGHQRMLLIGAIGIAVFLIPMAFVNTVLALALFAICMSLFQGLLTTSAVSLLPTVVTAAALSSMFGLYQSVQALSSQLGPALGGVIAVQFGYQAVFLIAAAALMILGLPMFVVFKRVAAKYKVEAEPEEVHPIEPHIQTHTKDQIEKSVDSQTPSTGR
ncbi:MAG: MFS transporter [Actinomycetota bacterium]|nr:MFS transporter [Actinomycetota bacterium]